MQKKSKLLIFLPIILLSIIVLSITTGGTAFAVENTSSNYDVKFPNPDTYVKLENPTEIGVSDNNLVIFDNGKLFVKGNFANPIELTKPNETISIRSLQISNDLIAYICDNKINIINKLNPSISIQEKLDEKLINYPLEIDSVFDIYLQNNILFFVIGKKLYSTSFVNGDFTAITIVEDKASLFLSSNIYVNEKYIYYTNENNLKKFDRTTKETTDITKFTDKILFNDLHIIEYNIGDEKNNYTSNICIKDSNNNVLKNLSNTEINIKAVSDIKLNNNMLFIVDNTSKDVVEYNIENLLNNESNYPTINVYGMTGDFKDKLNEPTSIKYSNGKTYVLDTLNYKVKDITNTNIIEYPLDKTESIMDFEVNGNTIYYFTQNTLHVFDILSSEDKSINIANISKIRAYKNSILMLVENKLKLFDNATNPTLLTIDDIVDFNLNIDGNFVYIRTANTIDKYIFDNEKLVKTSISFNLNSNGITNLIDYEIDKNGNLYLLYESKIAKVTNDALNYTNVIVKKLNNTNYLPVYLSDIQIVNDRLYIVDKGANLVYIVNDADFNNIVTNVNKQPIDLGKKPLNELDVYKTNTDTLMFTYLNNFEDASIIPSGKILWVFNEENSALDGKKMVLFDNKIGFIYPENISKVSKINNSFNAKAIVNTTLYMYPSVCKDAELIKIHIDTDNTKMRVLSTTEYFDSNYLWYEVEYEGNRYFAIQNDIDIDNEKQNTISTMIVKSKKIGEKVNIYEIANTNSNVILTIKDGEKVEVLAKNGDFYKVKYNNKIGFVKCENLINKGLTNNQIVAIVISVVTIVVALIIFISTIIIRKNKNKIK